MFRRRIFVLVNFDCQSAAPGRYLNRQTSEDLPIVTTINDWYQLISSIWIRWNISNKNIFGFHFARFFLKSKYVENHPLRMWHGPLSCVVIVFCHERTGICSTTNACLFGQIHASQAAPKMSLSWEHGWDQSPPVFSAFGCFFNLRVPPVPPILILLLLTFHDQFEGWYRLCGSPMSYETPKFKEYWAWWIPAHWYLAADAQSGTSAAQRHDHRVHGNPATDRFSFSRTHFFP